MDKKKRHAQTQRRYAARQPPEWMIWKGMKRRCYDKHHDSYEFYGARGITVCARWLEHGTGFSNFIEDMGPIPSKEYSLDRKDPDKGYEKGNCQWRLRSENFGTSRGCFGQTVDSSDEDVVPF